MTNPTDPLRIPITRSVTYAARDLPDLPFLHGPGVIKPYEITLTYRASPDSQLGRVHAYVAGRLWVDGVEVPLLSDGLYGQHYDDGLDGWPEWLAEEARLHDPEAASVPSAPTQTADADRRDRYAQAIRDSNGTLQALAAWQRNPQLIPAAVYADAAMAVADAEQAAIRAAVLAEVVAVLSGLDGEFPNAREGFRAGVDYATRRVQQMAAVPAAVEEQPDTGTPHVCWCGHPEDRHWKDQADRMTFPDGCHDCPGWNGAHGFGRELPWATDDTPAAVAQPGKENQR